MYNYNLHCHSLLSDGALLPSEIAVRYLSLGYRAIAITDHVDYSNIETAIEAILKFCQRWPKNIPMSVLSGIELTHIPLEQFKPLSSLARKKGIKVIIGHGETTVEPVIKGTNRAALMADIDILAHPGKISDADTRLAKRKNVFLEITSRLGHSDTNSFVVQQARKFGTKLILNQDSHKPEDIITPEQLIEVGFKAGLNLKEIARIYKDVGEFINNQNK
ncbi:MAG: histidinol phosphate phosphatase domain-containing protein [Candidatus Omnitrophota bacterium]|nr:histidinol phosphate phosphatase domain-containing protein [Candidatus Omnitrophota bacterium]